MSDEVIQLPSRQIDIPARFIRQAFEHIDHTGSRYATLLFAGESIADAVCVGIITRRMITDQRPLEQREPQKRAPTSRWTLKTLTDEVILDVIKTHGPITTRRIGDQLGIAKGHIPLRQRIRRVLVILTAAATIERVGEGRFPKYGLIERISESAEEPKQMPLRPDSPRKITRKHITVEVIADVLRRGGNMTSKTIGDELQIPRHDTMVRGKITETIGKMLRSRQARQVTRAGDGGRVYELVDEASVANSN